MKKLALLAVVLSASVGCGTSSQQGDAPNSQDNRGDASASNITANSTPYSRSENAYRSAGNSSLGRVLRPSVGKSASEIKLWTDGAINPRLQALMGADYAEMRKTWQAETPIKKYGDFVLFTGCERANCTTNRYVVIADTSYDNINVLHIGKDSTREWRENSYIDLPPPLKEELAKMTTRN